MNSNMPDQTSSPSPRVPEERNFPDQKAGYGVEAALIAKGTPGVPPPSAATDSVSEQGYRNPA